MVFDMNYWTKVGKRLLAFILTIIGILLGLKLAVFYMPFLIAFIIKLPAFFAAIAAFMRPTTRK